MRIEFVVYAKPFSLNSAYYLKSYGSKSATKIRTKECRAWGDEILSQLQPMTDKMMQFTQAFNDKSHAIRIELVHLIPNSVFYTKAGHISAATCDITNIEKLLVDLLFDARFHGRENGTGKISNFNINDKFIVEMKSSKLPSKREYKIKIVLEIIPQPEINDE
jgi:hypothetical protein